MEGIKGFAADGSTMLSQNAICLLDPGGDGRPVTVRVHERLRGCTLRVALRGRTIPSITEADERHGGDTTLVIPIPRPEDISSKELVGCARVFAVLDPEAESQPRSVDPPRSGARNRRSGRSRRGGADASNPDPDANLVQIGASVPLLLVPDKATASEIADAVRTIRSDLGDAQATRFVTRLGNCVSPATINDEDLGAAMEVTKVLDMRLTERMMLESMFTARREDADRANRDGGSEAGDDGEGGKYDDGGSHSNDAIIDDSLDAAWGEAAESPRSWGGVRGAVGLGRGGGRAGWLSNDDVAKMLRRDPGLRRSWMGTIDLWEARVWYIAMACIVIHWFTTKRHCNLGTSPYVRSFIGSVLTSIFSLGKPLPPDEWLRRRGFNVKLAYLYVGGICMWWGYGEGGSSILRDDMHGQCSKTMMHSKGFVCMSIMMLVYAIHPLAHGNLRGLATTCVVCFALPYLSNHALGLAEYNGFWTVSIANVPAIAEALGKLPWDGVFVGKVVDAIASAAFMFVGYWAFPVTLARVIQREYVRRLGQTIKPSSPTRARRRLSPL